jgi:hypothetical protein
MSPFIINCDFNQESYWYNSPNSIFTSTKHVLKNGMGNGFGQLSKEIKDNYPIMNSPVSQYKINHSIYKLK